MTSRRWAALLLAVAGVACATNPATGRRQLILMSEAEERQLGQQTDAEVRDEMGLYADDELRRYVAGVGARLAARSHRATLPWTFGIVDDSAVNAFALPGGYIYVTRGLLPFLRDEAELAAVLGHEVGHVDARHSVESYSKQTLTGVGLAATSVLWPRGRPFVGAAGLGLQFAFLSFGRAAELESDRLGVGYAVAEGWRPDGMLGLLGTLGRLDAAQGSRRGVPNWALTHPPAADRIARVNETVLGAKAASPGATAANRDLFERRLEGLVVGDSREQGFVRGSEFAHPVLRFAVQFPEGWEVRNGRAHVTAVPADEDRAGMTLAIVRGATGAIERAARQHMTDAGFTLTDGQSRRLNGLDAFVGTYTGVASGTRVVADAAHIRLGDTVYVVAGLAAEVRHARHSAAFAATIRSFRPLSAGEADRLQPDRLGFHVVRAGDTWESIARAPGSAVLPASRLAIMNGQEPSEPPAPGSRVRVVLGG